VRFGTLPVGFGTSCAILLTGLVIGWARSRYPLSGGIPKSATRILQDIGLTVFIAIVGPHAVESLHERGTSFFLTIFAAGVIVTMVPQILGCHVGAKLLKLPVAALLWGLADAQTATPALRMRAATTCSSSASPCPTRSTMCCCRCRAPSSSPW
jgi:putative transport protein